MAAPNPNASIPWDQTPEYISLTDHVIPPGGQTSYTVPHPAGASPTDHTAFVYGQRDIREGHWPEIMYVLFPTPEWEAFKGRGLPHQKMDANQQPMFERWPKVGQRSRQLLDFPILPDTISSREELWRFDLWRKMDPRMSWDDLTMRIEVPGRTDDGDRKLQNSIQTMLKRYWHQNYHMISWFGKGRRHYSEVNNPSRVTLLAELANAIPPIPVNLNTTKGLTPGSINPGLGPNGPVIPWPSIRGGTIRGPRRAAGSVVPATANAAALIPPPVVPPVAALVPPPATAPVSAAASTEDSRSPFSSCSPDANGSSHHLSSQRRRLTSNLATTESGQDDSGFGDDTVNDIHGDSSELRDSPVNAATISDAAGNGDDSDVTMGEVADSEEERASHSFDSRRSIGARPSAMGSDSDIKSTSVNGSSETTFTPMNRARSSKPPPAKRRCIGPGIRSNLTAHQTAGGRGADITTPAVNNPPSYGQILSPVPAPSPSQTPDIAAAADYFDLSGDLPPDGYSC